MKTVLFIRGLPGSGKSTLAKLIVDGRPDAVHVEADQFFMHNGEYRFDASKLAEAHSKAIWDMIVSTHNNNLVVVSNTFSRLWELNRYKDSVPKGVKIVVADLYDNRLTDEQLFSRCVHNVPIETIKGMRARWER